MKVTQAAGSGTLTARIAARHTAMGPAISPDGKRLFASDRVGCHKCHPPPLYTDRKVHKVGTKSPPGYSDRFDTPTLVEAWRTAPYLHGGRYVTIKELIAKGKHGKSRGRIDKLSEQEIDDLAEFVLSL